MSITESAAWKALEAHHKDLGQVNLKQLFAADPERFSHFTVQFNDILLDYSKNWVTEETVKLLSALLDAAKVGQWTKQMFSGEAINSTENRAVLHVALRNRSNTPVIVDGKDVMPEVCVSWLLPNLDGRIQNTKDASVSRTFPLKLWTLNFGL
jgi:glucose-6-phosphate isomerase